MKKNILVVEDNEMNMKLMFDILSASNYNVDKAFDGEEALELLSLKEYNLVLLDIHLPEKSGYDVMKEMESKSPVMVVSASCMDSDVKKANDLGAIGFISKPIKVMEFLSRINAFLG